MWRSSQICDFVWPGFLSNKLGCLSIELRFIKVGLLKVGCLSIELRFIKVGLLKVGCLRSKEARPLQMHYVIYGYKRLVRLTYINCTHNTGYSYTTASDITLSLPELHVQTSCHGLAEPGWTEASRLVFGNRAVLIPAGSPYIYNIS